MLLNDLPTDRDAWITEVDGRGSPVMLRLMEMGLVPGASVRVRKRAPFHGPLELVVEGYLLSIRSKEARCLSVRLEPRDAPVPRSDEGALTLEPSPEEAA